jgi:transposase-like protein
MYLEDGCEDHPVQLQDDSYPTMIKSWRDTWDDFIPFLEFPVKLRKIVYTTNAIYSLNARFPKAAVRRGHFPTE